MTHSRKRSTSYGPSIDQRPARLPELRYRVVARLGVSNHRETLWVTADETYAHWLAAYWNHTTTNRALVEQAVLERGRVEWRFIEDPQHLEARRQWRAARKRPTTGDIVLAVLSETRTKRGGWRAAMRVGDENAEGPIVNSDEVPANAKPKDLVRLRVGAMSRENFPLHFLWCEESYAFESEIVRC